MTSIRVASLVLAFAFIVHIIRIFLSFSIALHCIASASYMLTHITHKQFLAHFHASGSPYCHVTFMLSTTYQVPTIHLGHTPLYLSRGTPLGDTLSL
jgi:hypothetical protein